MTAQMVTEEHARRVRAANPDAYVDAAARVILGMAGTRCSWAMAQAREVVADAWTRLQGGES